MQIHNIDRILVFRQLRGRLFTLEEIARHYPIDPAGTLTYYGIVEQNVAHFRRTGQALNESHRAVVQNLLASLRAGARDEMTFQLAVEPLQRPRPYDFVAANMPLVEALAIELQACQSQARDFGKRLAVVVRYASEMNDSHGAPYAGDPSAFRESFVRIRTAFARHAPHVRFTFSPALRADLDVARIEPYWPGDEYVDVVGATWYVHGDGQRRRGMANMRTYFSDRVGLNKPFGLDEFGGALGDDQAHYRDNDLMLEDMLHEIEALRSQNVSFAYGTIFLDDRKYGVDATLRFLAGHDGT